MIGNLLLLQIVSLFHNDYIVCCNHSITIWKPSLDILEHQYLFVGQRGRLTVLDLHSYNKYFTI